MPDLDVDCDDGITANTSHDSRRVSGKGRGRRGGGGPAGSRGRGGRGSHSAPPGSRSLQSKPRPRVSASGAVGVAAAAPTVAELTQAGGALPTFPNLLSQDDEDDESESEAFRVKLVDAYPACWQRIPNRHTTRTLASSWNGQSYISLTYTRS